MSVRDRYPEAIDAVQSFFAQFYGARIVQTEDAGAELVLFHVGQASKIIAVSRDFLGAFSPQEIRENLASWNVAALSRTLERGCRLLITSEGTQEERD